MDLLKIALKLGPFCEPRLFREVLALTVDARSLDVAASPYETSKDYGVEAILVETPGGKKEYKEKQTSLMKKAEPIRKDLLENYERFLFVVSGTSGGNKRSAVGLIKKNREGGEGESSQPRKHARDSGKETTHSKATNTKSSLPQING